MPYRVGNRVRNGADKRPLSRWSVWPPPYDTMGRVTFVVSAHIHAAVIAAEGSAYAWGCGSNDGRCGVERFLNGELHQADFARLMTQKGFGGCRRCGPCRCGHTPVCQCPLADEVIIGIMMAHSRARRTALWRIGCFAHGIVFGASGPRCAWLVGNLADGVCSRSTTFWWDRVW